MGDSELVLILERHLLHLTPDFHLKRMRLNVTLLLLFISLNPDLSRVLLRSDELRLLLDLIEKLLALDLILLFT